MLWETSQEDNSDIMALDYISLPAQMANNSERRVNLDESMKSVSDEVSFYGNGGDLNDSPARAREAVGMFCSPQPLLQLLSPEQSPQYFAVLKDGGKNVTPGPKGLNDAASKTVGVGSAKNRLRFFNSLSSCSMCSSSVDDDYMELYDVESCDVQVSNAAAMLPSNMSNLIKGRMVLTSPAVTPKSPENGVNDGFMNRPSVRRCLSLSENANLPKTPEQLQLKHGQKLTLTPSGGFKRPEPPTIISSTLQIKRLRNDDKEKLLEIQNLSIARPPLRKSMSVNDADKIMSALSRSESGDNLIGDFSKPFALPIMEKGNHSDLKSISSDTVARLLMGEFNNEIASFKIIDCRYPYEYEGGHIVGAKNLYTPEQIMLEFLNDEKTDADQMLANKGDLHRKIIIFHCEFSSERGPKLSRYLRNADRNRNTAIYPSLNYPEIYLLHNGYKEFFETHAELCEPHAYRPMLSPGYGDALRHFRAKSKSWNCEGVGGGGGASTSRSKKSRSRLIL